ncbi:MAG: glycine-rich domain-containing protein [Gemmatimonadota bacterium]
MVNPSYGIPAPPNRPTRFPPPAWRNCRAWLAPGTYTDPFVVPQNVYQLYVVVIGAGGSGGLSNNSGGFGLSATGGGGGGCISAILDVVPGQPLPTITVGAGGAALTTSGNGNAGGTSSFGSLMTATGGGGGTQNYATATGINGGTGGTGSGADGCRSRVAAAGGRGGNRATTPGTSFWAICTGGGAPGTPYGDGGRGGDHINSSWNGTAAILTGGGGIAGGNGGDITVATSWSGSTASSGGGAFRVPCGDINATTTSNNYSTGGAGTYGRSLPLRSPGITQGPGGPGFGVFGGESGTTAVTNGSLLNSLLPSQPWQFLVDPSVLAGSGGGCVNSAASVPTGNGGLGAGGGAGFPGIQTSGRLTCAGGVGGGGGAVFASASGDCQFTNISLGFGGGGAIHSRGTSGQNTQTNNGIGGGGGGMAIETGSGAVFSRHGTGGDGAVFIFWTEGF